MDLREDEKCEYVIKFATPAACWSSDASDCVIITAYSDDTTSIWKKLLFILSAEEIALSIETKYYQIMIELS